MDVDEEWWHTHEQRRSLAALLGDLSDEEWTVPSLCQGWTVRDVAAHVMRSATVTPVEVAVALVRFGGRYNTLVADDARRAARRPVAELMADFQRHDGSRRRPFGTWVTDPLLDVLVHTQDTAVPPGRPDPMPIEPGGVAARRAHRLGFLFADFALRRHVEIQATDADFNVGKRAAGRGPHLRGPLAADRTHSRDGTRYGGPEVELLT